MLEHQLAVGKTYRFTFKPEFERHGVCTSPNVKCLHPGNGTFTLMQIATYGDIVAAGVDLFNNFFAPLGIKEDEYRQYFSGKPADAYTKEYAAQKVVTSNATNETIQVQGESGPTTKTVARTTVQVKYNIEESGKSLLKKEYLENLAFASYPIYKLVDIVNKDDILFVPERALKGFPEVDLLNYKEVTLSVNVGFWEDPQTLTPMLVAVRERLMAFGVPPLAVQLYTSNSAWMSKAEYDDVKTIRVPGVEVALTADNVDQYYERRALFEGSYKKIVPDYQYFITADTERDEDKKYYELVDDKYVEYTGEFKSDLVLYERAEGTVLGSQLIRNDNAVMDSQLFLKLLDPNVDRIFVTDQQYLVKIKDGVYKRLVENKDWTAGNPIPHYVLTNDKSRVSGKKYWKMTGGDTYAAIEAATCFEDAQAYYTAGIPIYTHEQDYKSCDESMSIDPSEVYYKRDELDAMKVADMTGVDKLSEDYFIRTRDEFIVASEVKQGVQYFVKGTAVATPIDDCADKTFTVGQVYERFPVYALDYSNEASINCLGKKFSYTDSMNTKITKELNATDIVMLSSEKRTGIRITNELAYREFKGRWFEFVAPENKAHYLKGDRVVVIVSEDNWSEFRDYVGTVYGVKGALWKDTIIADDAAVARNFYKLYQDEVQTNASLKAKVDALQRLVDKMQNDLEIYHSKG